MKQFTIEQLARIAKRDNNTKRSYLIVNPLQGKHIPVSPAYVSELFDTLCETMQCTFPNEKLLIIGFAETATAIGAALATGSPNVLFYVHTTREQAEGCHDYLYFSEEHSHATDQKLAITQIIPYMEQADRIIFAEDEVTTGNTISNLIRELKLRFPERPLKFGVVSILNGMPDDTLLQFRQNDIPCAYIQRIQNHDFDDILSSYTYPCEMLHKYHLSTSFDENWDISGRIDTKGGVIPTDYQTACKDLAANIKERLTSDTLQDKRLLILGTEESMYPALYAANYIEQMQICSEVRFHATTRSPILPSNDAAYPLHDRYELTSLAPTEHTIFMYNLSDYDIAIVIHEQKTPSVAGTQSLASTLKKCGVRHTICCKWSRYNNLAEKSKQKAGADYEKFL